ncbi:MAG: hypothetical protein M1828_002791 [Chrysothrix sp. TS-e1954]|nr:MAG: hypothetical protein M1828_002791 [Chrysothrix sp. TS-e1954]
MAYGETASDERTGLLDPAVRKHSIIHSQQDQASSIVESHISKDEIALDWLHDLVKDSYRRRLIHGGKGLRTCVAFLVDVAEATLSDWKIGYCIKNPLLNREACCNNKTPLFHLAGAGENCDDFHIWSERYWGSYSIYVAFALCFGIVSASVTLFTKRALPAAAPGHGDKQRPPEIQTELRPQVAGKSIFMAAGSGIPELKTHLSGFVIPHFLDARVLVVKAVGATFAVATGMCLGKEGPFVHISACVGYIVASRFSRYRDNGRKMRELLSAAVAAGMTVAFGAPIGGVLFSYEEISTYFPRKTLWRAFLCSAFAAMVLKALNPNGTGKLVLFETHYGTNYLAYHYLIFALIGVVGGIWGGFFCKLNFKWSKWFRSYPIIKNHPVFEIFLVVLVTGLLQYPNPLVREPGDAVIKNLLVDCRDTRTQYSWVCLHEAGDGSSWAYVGWLVYGCLVKLVLTIITFGTKVPSGIIIPAMDAGSLFGRLVGQWIGTISPGIFAMVGAGAFLAGVSRMTISLCVILFELTGELEYIIPYMLAILVAKWVADSLSDEGVYDLAQSVLGHPFLDPDHAMKLVQAQSPPHLVKKLIPPKQTMDEITVNVGKDNKAPRLLLEKKLDLLKNRGLMDAGLALVQNGMLQGYLAQGELEFGLGELGKVVSQNSRIRLLGNSVDGSVGHNEVQDIEIALNDVSYTDDVDDLDLSPFVDRTPLTLTETAPMEYAVEYFAKLGLRHMMVTEEGTARLVGVIIKKRLVAYLETLHNE